jgi:tRNA 2-thiouridine synthesizing protein E
MTDFSQWNKEVGEQLAKQQGITLTPRHWEVIEYIQDRFKNNDPLSIRGIKNSGVIDIKEFYSLFPNGPLKKATLIAGIPKPKSCI